MGDLGQFGPWTMAGIAAAAFARGMWRVIEVWLRLKARQRRGEMRAKGEFVDDEDRDDDR